MMNILEANGVQKIYHSRFSASQVEALKSITFSVPEGEFVAIMGESGSGKSTLLNILATLDKPTSGEISINGQNMSGLKKKDMAGYRRNHLGFIFQDYSLLDNFTNKDNIFLPLVLNGVSYKEMEQKLIPLAKKLKIQDLLKKYPYEISGGQKQRIAAARALITSPELILADEPTGALDSRSAQELLELFEELNREGQTILMVTHSTRAASYASRVLFIQDGNIYHQLYRGDQSQEQFFERISDTLTAMSRTASHE